MLWQPINLTEACPANTHVSACSPFGFLYLNVLVQLYGDSWDRWKQEEIRRNSKEPYHSEEDEEFDFIVVGAGAAGAVVANRLSENEQWKVLTLEAGGEQPNVTLVPALSVALLGSNIDWGYQTEPNGKSCLAREGQRCPWPRGKVMGGSSTINSMVYVRGNKKDYDDWAAMGNDGWSYEEVLQYFKKSEKNLDIEALSRKYHGVTGEQSVSLLPYIDEPTRMMIEAFHERGLPVADVNGANQTATMQAQTISQNGERVSTNNAFIQPIRYKRKNLTVKVNAEVTKILINKDKRAYGVKYVRNGKVQTAYAVKEVIVSGGTINSPKLLMLSGIGPKKHLSKLNITVHKDSCCIGGNLQDHVAFNGILVGLSNKTATLVNKEQMLRDIEDYSQMREKHGPLSGNGPNSFAAFIKTEPNLPAPNIQFAVGNAILDEYLREPEIYEQFTLLPTYSYDAVYIRPMVLVPKSTGKLLLNPDDPHGKPLIYANYLEDSRDVTLLLEAVKFILSLEETKPFKCNDTYFVKTPLKPCEKYPWGTEDYFLCLMRSYTSTSYHATGTCKMGPKTDKKAVVDPRLRVYGISGLRVIDSSIMPMIVRGNTNAPSIMIGEKGAAMVIEDWQNEIGYLKNKKGPCC